MRQVLVIPIHGSTPSSWKIAVPQSERAYARKSSKFLQMLTRLAKADRHEEFLRRKTDNYTRQRPKSVENCGADIELKARSQPMGTCLPARSSDGCDLGSFFAGAGALVSRSPLSARSTNCGLKTIPSVLGNDGKEIRTIEQSAVATIASRVIVLRISPSHP
jgi:hypothetical protein